MKNPNQTTLYYTPIKKHIHSSFILIILLLIATTGQAQVPDTHTIQPDLLSIDFPDSIFCPDLNVYVGDYCNDGNPETDVDYINEDCICTGFSSSFCSFFQYYLADHDPVTGVSDIYLISIENDVATMLYLVSSDIEVHIAVQNESNIIYAISKHENSYRYLDPLSGTWGPTITFDADYGEITAAAFAPNGKLLFASQDQDQIYSLNLLTNTVSTYDTYSPVTGGDLAFTSDGMLYMATRSGNGLYEVWPDDVTADVLLGNIPPNVTGLAATFEDQLLISAQGMTGLSLYNTDGTTASTSYPLELNGQPFTLRDGDLSSACVFSYVIEGCQFPTTFYVNHGPGIDGSDLYSIEFADGNANLTFITNVDFEAHIGFNPQAYLMYFVNKDGSNISIYSFDSGTFIGDLPILGDIDDITAVHYNEGEEKLYVGDASSDIIATINLNTGIASYHAGAPVDGGDITSVNGVLYLANRSASELYQIPPFGEPVLIGSIPDGVNGMTPMTDQIHLITASQALQAFVEINTDDGSTLATYPAMLNGTPFIITNGDMASGCFMPPQAPPGP